MKAIPLGQMLLEEQLITQEQLDAALEYQKKVSKRLGVAIIELGFISEKDLLKALALRLRVDYLESPLFSIELEAVRLIPENVARKYGIVPVMIRSGDLSIATTDPLDFACLEDIAMITGLEVKTILSSHSEIDKAIARVYTKRSADDIFDSFNAEEKQGSSFSEELSKEEISMAERVDSAPVVKLVNSLILEAYQLNASDIHIEPEADHTRVRFRIDGDLVIHNKLSNDLHGLISTRIKIISGMNIAEKRIPQDGSFQYKNEYTQVDIRVSSMPTLYGEKIVLRLLGADKNIDYDLASLGISKYTFNMIEKALKIPHGIVLVTGPTGSGKTTTLYSMISRIANVKKALVTIEDPIERKFEGITQIQVNPRAGLTFASGLRSILRQDPDTIMVGEIRDSETAEIAIRAAITGHFVLSTIHTNDAMSTINRLVDMGIEPYLVASSVKCVISQRLVKKICTHCKQGEKVEISDNLLLKSNLKRSYKGAGCVNCNNTGYSGRTAVFEILLIDTKLEDMISRRSSMEDLLEYANVKKMHMLRDEVLDYIEKGVTTVEEGIRILYTTD